MVTANTCRFGRVFQKSICQKVHTHVYHYGLPRGGEGGGGGSLIKDLSLNVIISFKYNPNDIITSTNDYTLGVVK